MRKPWFSIVEVTENSRRSLADIVIGVANENDISLSEMRGNRQHKHLKAIRIEALKRIWTERPDLSSGQIANFLHREGSSIRKLRARYGAAA